MLMKKGTMVGILSNAHISGGWIALFGPYVPRYSFPNTFFSDKKSHFHTTSTYFIRPACSRHLIITYISGIFFQLNSGSSQYSGDDCSEPSLIIGSFIWIGCQKIEVIPQYLMT